MCKQEYKQTKEHIEKRIDTRKRLSEITTTTMPITNGILTRRILKIDTIPEGWRFGCTKKSKKSSYGDHIATKN